MLFALLLACNDDVEWIETSIVTIHPDPGVTCYVYPSTYGGISCIADPYIEVVVRPPEDTGGACDTDTP